MTSKVRDAIKQAVATEARRRGGARSWSIEAPKGWQEEIEDTLTTYFDPDGVGALQFSSMTKTSGDVTEAELVESIEDMGLAGEPRAAASFGAFTGYALIKEHDDGQAGQYWFLHAGPLMLFATYFCETQDAHREMRVVMKTLATLRVLPGSNA